MPVFLRYSPFKHCCTFLEVIEALLCIGIEGRVLRSASSSSSPTFHAVPSFARLLVLHCGHERAQVGAIPDDRS